MLMLIVPGPDFVLVTRNALIGGRRQAAHTVLGICLGLAVLTCAAAAGVSALISSMPAMLTILRFAGGGYLLVLGFLLWSSAGKRSEQHAESVPARGSGQTPILRGLLNNLLNPKALIFYLTFLPRFLREPGPPVFAQTLVMGAIVVACAALWWAVYVSAIGYLRKPLERGSARTVLDRVAGTALAGLGVLTILDS